MEPPAAGPVTGVRPTGFDGTANTGKNRVVAIARGPVTMAPQPLGLTLKLHPASSAAFAGFIKERENLPHEAKVVLLITGNGLKDVDAALQLFEPGKKA
jgi:hypothetical protein